MTIKEVVEKVKTKFNEDRKTHHVDAYYTNGYMQALDDILKEVGTSCDEDKVTIGIDKDAVIRDLEAEIHRLKCENKDLVENIEELEASLEQERLDKYVLSEKWKVVEMFMK